MAGGIADNIGDKLADRFEGHDHRSERLEEDGEMAITTEMRTITHNVLFRIQPFSCFQMNDL